MFTCQICGQPATIHMTQINDGQKSDHHFCQAHLAGANLPPDLPGPLGKVFPTMQEQITKQTLAQFRASANFIRRHGRRPNSVAELREAMALPPNAPTTEITDPELLKALAFLDHTIRFIETHGRMPQSPEEFTVA